MQIENKKLPEILAPAGDFSRLVAAIRYGADAVYLAGTEFGMRASATNFNNEELKKAVEYAHSHNVKVYVTCNTLPRNEELDRLPKFLQYARDIGVDAFIVCDIGVLDIIKQYTPDIEVHISTQAGVVNYATANAFYKMGCRRIVLARETSLEEIKEIRDHIPKDMDIEVFVHGAMCVSFSGRCLLSNYLVNRDANRGECAQPCRWGYHLVEEKRPGEYYPIFEDEQGTHILNAKDLCMLSYLDKLAKAGVTSFKIEGRAKSDYYVSVVTNAYKLALLEYAKNPDNFTLPEWLSDEVTKVSHRRYSTGFYFDTPTQYYYNGGYERIYDVVAMVDYFSDGYLYVTQKNKFNLNETAELLQPLSEYLDVKVVEITDLFGNELDTANHAQMKVRLKLMVASKSEPNIYNTPLDMPIEEGSILRMKR